MLKSVVMGLAAACIVASVPASAAYIVDTGPAAGGLPWGINPGEGYAIKFTLAAPTTITSLEAFSLPTPLAQQPGYGNGGTLTAAIYAADGTDGTPGTELFANRFRGLGRSGFGWMGAYGLHWSLAADTYWAAFEVRAGQTFTGALGGDAANPLLDELYRSDSSNNGDWFAVTLRNGWRISDDLNGPPSNVPEPGSWLLLIAGFGLVGSAARSRRRLPMRAIIPLAPTTCRSVGKRSE